MAVALLGRVLRTSSYNRRERMRQHCMGQVMVGAVAVQV